MLVAELIEQLLKMQQNAAVYVKIDGVAVLPQVKELKVYKDKVVVAG